MTYPAAPLGIRVRIALGADLTAPASTYTWTDVTTYVDWSYTVHDKIGTTDDASESNTDLGLTFRNTDARFTTDNPESPYWPYFDVGCPLEIAVDNGDGGGYRDPVIGYLASAEDEWTSGTEYRCVTHVTAGGLFRRLGRNALSSALRRTILATARRKAYWPLEEAQGATQAESLVPGVPALMPGYWNSPPPEFGNSSGVAGSGTFATFRTGQRLDAYFAPSSATSFRVSFLLRANTPPSVDPSIFEVYAQGGTVYRYGLECGASGLRFRAVTAAGAEVSGAVFVGFTDHYSETVWVDVDVAQSGANITWAVRTTKWRLSAAGAPSGSTGFASGSWAGTIGQIYQVALAPWMNLDDVSIGHFTITEPPLPAFGGFAAVMGWAGSTAAGRAQSMCQEFGVPASVVSTAYGSLMGPQLTDSLLANLRDVANTDHGVLTDHTGVVSYRALQELYNLAPGLTLSRATRGQLGHIGPKRDDTTKANVASASRPNGSTFVLTDAADVVRAGRYEREPITVNVALDSALPGHAGWALARGTAKGKRFPQLDINMRVACEYTPGLSAQVLALQLGDRIAISSLPPQAAKGGIERQVRGRTRTFDGRWDWRVVYDLVQTEPYDAFILDSDRLDTSGTEVLQAASTTDTTLMVATGGAQITTGAGLNIPLSAAGEQVTLTAVTNEPLTDPFTRVVANGWGSTPATANLPAHAWAQGGSTGMVPGDFAATGSAATMSVAASPGSRSMSLVTLPGVDLDVTAHGSYAVSPTGGSLELQITYRQIAGGGGYTFRLVIQTSLATRAQLFLPSGTMIADVPLSIVHAPGQVYRFRCAPVGSRHQCWVWVGATMPTSPTIDLTDTSRLTAGYVQPRAGRASGNTNAPAVATWDNFQINNIQALTVTRSVNGVVKALPVGSAVRLWRPRGLGIGA
jgi:hypothetical protein